LTKYWTKLWIYYFFGGVWCSNSGPCMYLCIIPINWANFTRTKL